MQIDELREKYLAFFESKGHRRCVSDVLVPRWDHTVIFTPAGMNQFKDHFLGKVKLEFTRATSCQKCLRTGDIDNVGRTAYHHTFFEMLGNFSFGDYFKRDAIHWAWEFLTDKKWLAIDPQRLTATVYLDDDEAAGIWSDEIGLPTSRIERCDEDENFWPASAPSQGPDGVCGPCSEIYYIGNDGKPVEIWNLVFTQFNRVGDPPDNLRGLPSKNIDTGMGLERAAATLQGHTTNYHIDNLKPIVEAAAEVCGVSYAYESDAGRRLRRITDHVRACTFAIHENVDPGNQEDRYVIKRLLRRAVLDGHQLGLREPFLYQIVPTVIQTHQQPYPELNETVDRVQRVMKKEEARFFDTVDGGLRKIEHVFESMRKNNRVRVEGDVAAELYQTYGFPPELLETIAAEHQFTFDWDGYERAKEKHVEVSGRVKRGVMGSRGPIDSLKQALHRTEFVGYETTEAPGRIRGIVVGTAPDDSLCERLEASPDATSEVRVVLDKTPFYGESGGQVGDAGRLETLDAVFEVRDTQKDGDLVIHIGTVTSGTLAEGATVRAVVDTPRRDAIRRAHSATHVLHHALQTHLGDRATQQGSKVDDDLLRFDFDNEGPVTEAQLADIRATVDKCITANAPISWQTLPIDEARQQGAMMLFGEKYPDMVRMVSMGEFSKELCGGTHLDNTSQIVAFEVLSESGIADGVRRIVALTGDKAIAHRQQTQEVLDEATQLLQTDAAELITAVDHLLAEYRRLKKELASGAGAEAVDAAPPIAAEGDSDPSKLLARVSRRLSTQPAQVAERIRAIQMDIQTMQARLTERAEAGPLTAQSLLEAAETIEQVTVVVAEAAAAEANLMRQLIDQVRKHHAPAAVLLASTEGDNKVTLIAGVSKDLCERNVSANDWIRPVAKTVGGGGGGRPDMAQAGGKQPHKLADALELARQTIRGMLAS